MTPVNEVSTTRLWTHLHDENPVAIISPYRTECNDAQNLARLAKLKTEMKIAKHGFTEFMSTWSELGSDGTPVLSKERSLMIYGIELKEALELGSKYKQSAIIFKDRDKCALVCTCPFTTIDGASAKPGDVVKTFDLSNPRTSMNLTKAEEMLNGLRSGAYSMQTHGDRRPFTLTAVHEVEQLRPSYFGTSETVFI